MKNFHTFFLCNIFLKFDCVGDWKHDVRHGFGAYYYPNGDVYEGHWRRGLKEGLGTYIWADSKETKFLGIWKKGRMEGPGQMIHERHRYHGNFMMNMVNESMIIKLLEIMVINTF